MARFASGKDAWGYSDRSGFRYRLREMVTEWNGFKVGPDEFEPKHPQLGPIRVGPDPQALHDPRPRSTLDPVTVRFPTFDLVSLQFISLSFAKTEVGSVTISGAVTSITVEPTSVTAQTFIGNISVVISGAASRFDSTNVTLDTSNKTFDEG
jgi:hypothetical protein